MAHEVQNETALNANREKYEVEVQIIEAKQVQKTKVLLFELLLFFSFPEINCFGFFLKLEQEEVSVSIKVGNRSVHTQTIHSSDPEFHETFKLVCLSKPESVIVELHHGDDHGTESLIETKEVQHTYFQL